MQFVITFISSHHAMQANKKFVKSKIKSEIIPTPRQISSECGFSIQGEADNLQELTNFCQDSKLSYEVIYIKKEDRYEKS
ncbi:MAG: DUF3343 domain-containing protein [Candidatus Cloacimonadales bacterium]